MAIAFKVVVNRGGVLGSYVVDDRGKALVEYAQGVDTVPEVGCLMAFKTKKQAKAFKAINSPPSITKKGENHIEVWRCDVDIAPDNPQGLLPGFNDSDRFLMVCRLRGFWNQTFPPERLDDLHPIPEGTIFCKRIQLVKKVR